MTFLEACEALGYDEPLDWMNDTSRVILIETVERFTDDGSKSIDPADAARIRAEVDMFA